MLAKFLGFLHFISDVNRIPLLFHKLFLSFSMYENTNPIFVRANTFLILLNGLVLLLAWVLLLPKINAAAKQCPLKDIPLGNIMAKLRKKPDANLKKTPLA